MTKWYVATVLAFLMIAPAYGQQEWDEEEVNKYEGSVIRESDQYEKRVKNSRKQKEESGNTSPFSVSVPEWKEGEEQTSEQFAEPEYEPFAPNHNLVTDQTNDKPQDVPDPPDPPDLPINQGLGFLFLLMLGYGLKTGFNRR